MTAPEKLAAIQRHIDQGHTVYVCTHTKSIRINAKTVATWAAAGRPLLKLSGDDLLLGRGSHYDCIHSGTIPFGAIRVYDEQ